MIEVIEHGKNKFEAICFRCGCKFTYQLEDLETPYGSECVYCPDCHEIYYHPRQNSKSIISMINKGELPPLFSNDSFGLQTLK